MKIKDIAKKYNIDHSSFEKYLIKVGAGKLGFFSLDVTLLDEDIPGHVERYKKYLVEEEQREKHEKEEEERRKAAEEKKQIALSNMLITSGFNFDGYTIKKYSGYISGDDAVSVSRGTDSLFDNVTDVGQVLTAALVKIRRRAIQELKEAAYDLGCNAVIGVDFDYITLEPETANGRGGTTYLPYVFCVTANGNAEIIEKDE